jgi:Raf kinase inhibitor-like YbhB/YbcL family protein
MDFLMRSPAFRDGDRIPDRFTAYADNVSPPLEWEGAPEGARSFVLVVEDPDAPKGTFRHWGVWDIPAGRNRIDEGTGSDGGRPAQARNDFGNARWDGPRPPEGHGVHHYHFRLAALDIDRLDLRPGATVEEVREAARPHIIAEADLVGTYER